VAKLSPTKSQAQLQLDDGYLLALAKQGSADAYDHLVRRYASFVRLKEGARFPRHAHHGTEEVVVIAGGVSLGGTVMEAGDYLFTEPGEEHDVVALTDCVLFVSSQRSTPVVER